MPHHRLHVLLDNARLSLTSCYSQGLTALSYTPSFPHQKHYLRGKKTMQRLAGHCMVHVFVRVREGVTPCLPCINLVVGTESHSPRRQRQLHHDTSISFFLCSISSSSSSPTPHLAFFLLALKSCGSLALPKGGSVCLCAWSPHTISCCYSTASRILLLLAGHSSLVVALHCCISYWALNEI